MSKIEEVNKGTAAGAGNDGSEEIPAGSSVQIRSKKEAKARKLVKTLKLKRVEGISRVTMRQNRNVILVIANPEVYKNPGTGTYVVLGDVKVEDMAATARAAAATAAVYGSDNSAGETGETAAGAPSDPASIQAELAATAASKGGDKAAKTDTADPVDEEIDLSGLKIEDVDLVADQANVSRGKAGAALRKCQGDVVNAIMELCS